MCHLQTCRISRPTHYKVFIMVYIYLYYIFSFAVTSQPLHKLAPVLYHCQYYCVVMTMPVLQLRMISSSLVIN
ncbi:uncharacterized protein BO96DRAFT_253394 [Aspergillus niger CBS 101883]|uniref:uncharacterized protein n=1 Tax=Aspergillus lacticoffeatus (strain CBS 101883) TaxID=1450533 RepID=UPI000D805D94|nr:uncharacterized protein BO96DRAFT_253394 [Aspergillus niger CBS 101883]PYH58060.1 hypothetical protein BO96DRAFT_253394 [Aspergillus niger CBS 101883]